jgi:hypothetical protein
MTEALTGWHEDFGDEPSIVERYPEEFAPDSLPIDEDGDLNTK